MERLFWGWTDFNSPLDSWDFGLVTDAAHMFKNVSIATDYQPQRPGLLYARWPCRPVLCSVRVGLASERASVLHIGTWCLGPAGLTPGRPRLLLDVAPS